MSITQVSGFGFRVLGFKFQVWLTEAAPFRLTSEIQTDTRDPETRNSKLETAVSFREVLPALGG